MTDLDDDTLLKDNYNVHDNLKHLSTSELKQINSSDRLPYAVCALNVSGNLNIGIMIRSAVIFGAEKFIVYGRRFYDRRSCVGSHNYIPIDRIAADYDGDFSPEIFHSYMEEHGYYPIYIEQGGQPLDNLPNIMNKINDSGLKPCLVFGSESKGLPFEINPADSIEIKQRGVIRSLNVSTAAGIVMHRLSSFYDNN